MRFPLAFSQPCRIVTVKFAKIYVNIISGIENDILYTERSEVEDIKLSTYKD